jgi:hypothetical protein
MIYATDYSLGLTVRIAVPLKLNPEFVIPSCGPADDAAHHARSIQFLLSRHKAWNLRVSAYVRFDRGTSLWLAL